jgi:hypothetical protein
MAFAKLGAGSVLTLQRYRVGRIGIPQQLAIRPNWQKTGFKSLAP